MPGSCTYRAGAACLLCLAHRRCLAPAPKLGANESLPSLPWPPPTWCCSCRTHRVDAKGVGSQEDTGDTGVQGEQWVLGQERVTGQWWASGQGRTGPGGVTGWAGT